MVFTLSAQLDDVGDPQLPFTIYDSYVEHNRRRFPDSVLELIDSRKFSGGSDSESPYCSRLESMSLDVQENRQTNAHFVYWKGDYLPSPITIEVTYENVRSLDISENELSSLTWRYNEFLFHRPTDVDAPKKFFTHNIQWVGNNIWSVTAENINVIWKPAD